MTLTFVDPAHAYANAEARHDLLAMLDDIEREEWREPIPTFPSMRATKRWGKRK